VPAAPGGTWPSGPDIDHFVIAHMIDSYGHNGEKLWAAEPTQPAADPRANSARVPRCS
jgi:hypothetical protein